MKQLKSFLYSILVVTFLTLTAHSAVLTQEEEGRARTWLATYACRENLKGSLGERLQRLDEFSTAEHINNPIKGEWSLLQYTIACLIPDSLMADHKLMSQKDFLDNATLALMYLLSKLGINVDSPFRLSGYEKYGFYPGDTVLMALSRRDSLDLNIKVMRLLIENDAELETQDKDGNTPVIAACQCSRLRNHKMAKFLVTQGAMLEATNNAGYDALFYVENEADKETLRKLAEDYPLDLESESW